MPFGLHSATATFQRVLYRVIDPEMSPHTFAYQDDIKVIRRTLEEHKANLNEVFWRLKEANLRLKQEKSQFFMKELLYLGHRVSENSQTNDLLRKGNQWVSVPEHQTAFEEVKARLVQDWRARTSTNRSPCKRTRATTASDQYRPRKLREAKR